MNEISIPRTDKACDYTSPEKLHRLCEEMERELHILRITLGLDPLDAVVTDAEPKLHSLLVERQGQRSRMFPVNDELDKAETELTSVLAELEKAKKRLAIEDYADCPSALVERFSVIPPCEILPTGIRMKTLAAMNHIKNEFLRAADERDSALAREAALKIQVGCHYCGHLLDATKLTAAYECPRCLATFTGAESIKSVLQEREDLRACLARARTALDEIWKEADCGHILHQDGTKECGKCGGVNVHFTGCIQDILEQALSSNPLPAPSDGVKALIDLAFTTAWKAAFIRHSNAQAPSLDEALAAFKAGQEGVV